MKTLLIVITLACSPANASQITFVTKVVPLKNLVMNDSGKTVHEECMELGNSKDQVFRCWASTALLKIIGVGFKN